MAIEIPVIFFAEDTCQDLGRTAGRFEDAARNVQDLADEFSRSQGGQVEVGGESSSIIPGILGLLTLGLTRGRSKGLGKLGKPDESIDYWPRRAGDRSTGGFQWWNNPGRPLPGSTPGMPPVTGLPTTNLPAAAMGRTSSSSSMAPAASFSSASTVSRTQQPSEGGRFAAVGNNDFKAEVKPLMNELKVMRDNAFRPPGVPIIDGALKGQPQAGPATAVKNRVKTSPAGEHDDLPSEGDPLNDLFDIDLDIEPKPE